MKRVNILHITAVLVLLLGAVGASVGGLHGAAWGVVAGLVPWLLFGVARGAWG